MSYGRFSNLEGKHALFGASNWHWINYTEEQMIEAYLNKLAVERGTKLHKFAAQCLELGQRLPNENKTLSMYVNDSIDYGMQPEQVLYHSVNFFGTTDAISFRNGLLRIHDLKTGKVPAHMEQLLIYNALFCLERKIKPSDIDTELRIYQNNESLYYRPSTSDILPIMDKIVTMDQIIKERQQAEEDMP